MNDGAPNGIALLDKPQGITSHDAVARLRRALGTKKVGHAGTLDPMATGLLILGVGPSTRLLTHLVGLDKEYVATIRLGVATTSDDADGEVVAVRAAAISASGAGELTRGGIEARIARLSGVIRQRPSAVSAIKVDGVRAYDRVRAGEAVELAPRVVTVSEFALLAIRSAVAATPDGAELPVTDLDVRVRCSSGTYIRALARDLGEDLGVGGHLTALRRTEVGPFLVADAVPVPAWRERDAGSAGTAALPVPPPAGAPAGDRTQASSPEVVLLSPATVAARLFPVVSLTASEAADLANGKRLEVDAGDADTAAALAPDGRLVGLVEVRNGRTRVLTNFPASDG